MKAMKENVITSTVASGGSGIKTTRELLDICKSELEAEQKELQGELDELRVGLVKDLITQLAAEYNQMDILLRSKDLEELGFNWKRENESRIKSIEVRLEIIDTILFLLSSQPVKGRTEFLISQIMSPLMEKM